MSSGANAKSHVILRYSTRTAPARHTPKKGRVAYATGVKLPVNPLRDVLNQWSPVRSSPRSSKVTSKYPALRESRNLVAYVEKKLHDFSKEHEEFLQQIERFVFF